MTRHVRWTDIIVFGALWGILEATLGYALQFLPPWLSGSIMFPIGASILMMAYRRHGSSRMLVLIGLLAASIKAINLFMPGLPLIKTYNPMIAMMLQTMLVAVVLPIIKHRSLPVAIVAITGVSIGWRVLFMASNSLNVAMTDNTIRYVFSATNLVEFALVLGLIGAGMIVGIKALLQIPDLRYFTRITFKPAPALGAALLAVALTWFL